MPALKEGEPWDPSYGVGDLNGDFEGIIDLSSPSHVGYINGTFFFREDPDSEEAYAEVPLSNDAAALVDEGYLPDDEAKELADAMDVVLKYVRRCVKSLS